MSRRVSRARRIVQPVSTFRMETPEEYEERQMVYNGYVRNALDHARSEERGWLRDRYELGTEM